MDDRELTELLAALDRGQDAATTGERSGAGDGRRPDARGISELGPCPPPESTIAELRAELIRYVASTPRARQTTLGPSQLGHACDAHLIRHMCQCPRVPVTAPMWAPWQGTAAHEAMACVLEAWESREPGRWLIEARLEVSPAMEGVPAIVGSSDAYDIWNSMVVDWKLVGQTTIDAHKGKLRKGLPLAEQINPLYRVQAHLYALGHERVGRNPQWVRIVFLPRTADFDKAVEWTERYQPDVAIAALDRYYRLCDLMESIGLPGDHGAIGLVAMKADYQACKWCPFLRPGYPNDWKGCPGYLTGEYLEERRQKGIILPKGARQDRGAAA